MSNQSFGKYQLVKKLATGGMAEVWLAVQTGIEGFNRHVVVKRILPHLAEDPEFVQMFLNEAKIASRFNHPNIAQIYDLGAENGTYFIAMEFIHGEDLGRVMRRAWSTGQWVARHISLRIIADTCQGLYYAHTRSNEQGQALKVVHRDISPQNLLISFDGAVKIVDFGIAKAADQVSMTKSGAIKGKFAYMAPEQAAGKVLDARSDIYAVGLVLYELITGVRPLKRDSELATLQAALEGQIPPPSAVAEVPPEIDEVVMRALAKSPDDRYRDAREFQKAIEQYLMDMKEMANTLQVSELMEMLFADRLNEEQRLGVPNPATESSTSNPAAASYSAAMRPATPIAAEVAPPRSTPPAPPEAPPSSTMDEEYVQELADGEAVEVSLSLTDPSAVNRRARAAPEGTVGPSRKYAGTSASPRPSRAEATRVRQPPAPAPETGGSATELEPAPPAAADDDGDMTFQEGRRRASRTDAPRRTATGAAAAGAAAAAARRRATTGSMPEAPPRRSRSHAVPGEDFNGVSDGRISKLVNVEEMRAQASSRFRALISVMLLIGTVVLIVVFKEQVLGFINKAAAGNGALVGGAVRFSVTTNPPTQVTVRPASGTSRQPQALGSTPVDGSAQLGDTIVLTNDDRGIHWEEPITSVPAEGVLSISKTFKETPLRLETVPKLRSASVWRGGLKLGQVGMPLSVFPGTHHLEIRSDQLKDPFPFDVSVNEGQSAAQKIDVTSALVH